MEVVRTRVTGAMLREASGCPRRLALQLRERQGTKTANGRYRVSNRVTADVRLAHSTLRSPTLADFPDPADLLPEERTLHRAAAHAYCALFADVEGEVLDVDEWATVVADVRLVTPVGVPLTLADGTVEVRRLQLGGRLRTPGPDDLRLLALRLDRAAFRVVTADLVHVEHDVVEVDETSGDLLDARWLREQVRAVEARADEDRTVVTQECAWCAFVLDCPAHRP